MVLVKTSITTMLEDKKLKIFLKEGIKTNVEGNRINDTLTSFTFAKAAAISNVPTVSIFDAIIGTP